MIPKVRSALAWIDGRWHHATRDGRDGWWWDVGGFWYFYPKQIEGPPDWSLRALLEHDGLPQHRGWIPLLWCKALERC